MGTNDKIEERRRQNMPILIALDHLRRSKGLNQNEVCALLGVQSSRISEYKSGRTLAGDDFRGRLIDAFGGRLNIPFLYGESDVLLVENLKPAPTADGADARLRALQERVAEQEEFIATQRLLIETLRDRLRSLGVEYVAPSLPSRRPRPNAMDSEVSFLPSRSPRPYPVPAAASSTFSLPAAEPGSEEPSPAPPPASGQSNESSGNAPAPAPPVSPQQNKQSDN